MAVGIAAPPSASAALDIHMRRRARGASTPARRREVRWSTTATDAKVRSQTAAGTMISNLMLVASLWGGRCAVSACPILCHVDRTICHV
jgi:hypothetical protein